MNRSNSKALHFQKLISLIVEDGGSVNFLDIELDDIREISHCRGPLRHYARHAGRAIMNSKLTYGDINE